MELMAHDPEALAREIDRQISNLRRSRSFVDWNKTCEPANTLDAWRASIAGPLAATGPGLAAEGFFSVFASGGPTIGRVDEPSGRMGSLFREAIGDFATAIAATGDPDMQLAFAQRGAQPSIVSITSAFRLSPIAPPPSLEGEGPRRRLPCEDQKSGEDAEVLDEVLHLTVARNAGMIVPEVMQHEIDQQDVDDKPEGREFHMASKNEAKPARHVGHSRDPHQRLGVGDVVQLHQGDMSVGSYEFHETRRKKVESEQTSSGEDHGVGHVGFPVRSEAGSSWRQRS
jgi:hypothetical protein